MKDPIKKLIIIIAITLGVCQAVFYIMNKGIKQYNVHKNERLTEIFLNNTRHDVLFLGSSKTHTGIYPLIIDSITHLNSYNAGVEGGNILEIKMTLDGYLEKHPDPKLIVLHLDYNSFNTKRKFYNHTQYFPFIDNNKVLDSTLSANGHNTFLIKYLPFLGMTDYDDYTRSNSIRGLFGKTELNNEFQYKGYLSNTSDTVIATSGPSLDTITPVVSKGSIELLNSIVDVCHHKNIKLVFITPPEYKMVLNNKVLATIQTVSQKHKISLLRHDCIGLCGNNTLFANVGHLNTVGAKVYSIYLADEIKKILSIK